MKKKIILLDDDSLIRKVWKMSARDAGVELTVFENAKDLLFNLKFFPKDTLVYIDMNLKAKESGEETAVKLFNRGYLHLYLTTAYPSPKFQNREWIRKNIKKITSKTSPFV